MNLHDELVPLTDLVPKLEFRGNGLAEMRAALGEFFRAADGSLSPTVERVDHIVSTDPEVVVRVHRPVALRAPAACLYSIHGGGYVIGTYSMDDMFLDRYCNEFGFRWDHRRVTDGERMVSGIKGAEGKRLMYKQVH